MSIAGIGPFANLGSEDMNNSTDVPEDEPFGVERSASKRHDSTHQVQSGARKLRPCGSYSR